MSAELFFIICYFSLIVLCVFGIIWAIKVTRDSEPFWGSDRQWISVLSKITGKDVSKDYKRLSKQIKEEAISKRFKERCEQEYSIPTENIKNEEFVHTIKEINSLLAAIYTAYPNITSSDETILDCYVPEIIDLVKKYVALTNQPVQTNVSNKICSEITFIINDFKNAIEKHLHDQQDESILPVLSEIKAIRTKMTMDGFM